SSSSTVSRCRVALRPSRARSARWSCCGEPAIAPRIPQMRKRTILIMLLPLVLVAAGCGGSAGASDHGRKRVVAAFYPLAFAAEQIGGKRVRVENLTPPGAEPHDLEVSPANVQDIRSAGLVLLLGHGFQPQLEHAAGSGKRVLHLLDVPGLGRFPDNDPHVWLDPHRFSLIVERIGSALRARSAAARLVARLRALDRV